MFGGRLVLFLQHVHLVRPARASLIVGFVRIVNCVSDAT